MRLFAKFELGYGKYFRLAEKSISNEIIIIKCKIKNKKRISSK